MLSRTDAAGGTVNFTYDKLGRPTAETGDVNPTSSWTYDTQPNGIGKLATETSYTGTAGGTSRAETYDTFGRPTQTDMNVGYLNSSGVINWISATTQTTYDVDGRLRSTQYPSGVTVFYTYNGNGYPNSVNSGGISLWTPDSENDAMQVLHATYGNGTYTTAQYDPATGQPTNIRPMHSDGTQIRQFTYGWDVAGNLSSRTDGGQVAENFTYDTQNRLTGDNFTTGGSGDKTYSYSTIGDIVTKSDVGTYYYGAGGAGPHALTKISGTTNDGRGGQAGLVTDPTYTYDADGRMTGGTNGRSYTYSGFDAPATITNAGGTVTFYYDAKHNLVEQVTPSGTTMYVNEQGVRTEIFLPKGNATATYRNYVAAHGQIVDMIQKTGAAISHYYFHTDYLGSTMAVTDDMGAVQQHLSYDPWGKRRNLDGSDDTNDVAGSVVNRQFTGQEQLPDSFLVQMNARVYDPQIGKFTAGDPADGAPVAGGDWNRYAYVGNNPLNRVDPTGMVVAGQGNGAHSNDLVPDNNKLVDIPVPCNCVPSPAQLALGDLYLRLNMNSSGTMYGVDSSVYRRLLHAARQAPTGSHIAPGMKALLQALQQALQQARQQLLQQQQIALSGIDGLNNGADSEGSSQSGQSQGQQLVSYYVDPLSGAIVPAQTTFAPFAVDHPVAAAAIGATGLAAAGGVLIAAEGAVGFATIGDVAAALPEGMTPAQFGQLAGFSQGLAASSQASVEASAEVIANLKAAGVSSDAIATFQNFYEGVAAANPANASAIQRAALLSNILKGY
jgi:RHS repeat-associated protein